MFTLYICKTSFSVSTAGINQNNRFFFSLAIYTECKKLAVFRHHDKNQSEINIIIMTKFSLNNYTLTELDLTLLFSNLIAELSLCDEQTIVIHIPTAV